MKFGGFVAYVDDIHQYKNSAQNSKGGGFYRGAKFWANCLSR
jgi:hypothetical protein